MPVQWALPIGAAVGWRVSVAHSGRRESGCVGAARLTFGHGPACVSLVPRARASSGSAAEICGRSSTICSVSPCAIYSRRCAPKSTKVLPASLRPRATSWPAGPGQRQQAQRRVCDRDIDDRRPDPRHGLSRIPKHDREGTQRVGTTRANDPRANAAVRAAPPRYASQPIGRGQARSPNVLLPEESGGTRAAGRPTNGFPMARSET